MKHLATLASASLLLTGSGIAYAQQANFGDVPFSIVVTGAPNTTATNTTSTLEFSQAANTPAPFLAVAGWPIASNPRVVEFHNWSNYTAFQKRAEIVIADATGTPVATVPATPGRVTTWAVPAGTPAMLTYFLRVYDEKGRADTTSAKPLDLTRRARPDAGMLYAAAGSNMLATHTIRLSGSAIIASGSGVAHGESARFMGADVPVGTTGGFTWTQILPGGQQLVTSDIIGSRGQIRQEKMQEVSVATSDWFYVALADLTVGRNTATGPVVAATGQPFSDAIYIDGRLAFYLKGMVKGDWLLTASADTGEGPVSGIFSNFLGKDAKSVLRRLDPDKFYPVYGDASTSVNNAPTDGKLFVRLEKNGADILWGNFKTRTPSTSLANGTRALYGARAGYTAPEPVSRGNARTTAEVYAAQSGTQQSRDIYRGTGGSLYYLRNRDILAGSERVYIETRDAATGVVLNRRTLQEVRDYEINATQGRIQLSEPLASSAPSNMLVGSGANGENPQYLVVGYEYSPGIGAANDLVLGGSGDYWITDALRVGASARRETKAGNTRTVTGVDVQGYFGANSFVKLDAARTLNAASDGWQSLDGGFTFTAVQSGAAVPSADATRAELSVDLRDLGASDGRLGVVWQNRQAGFAGAGMETAENTTQVRATLEKGLGARTDMRLTYQNSRATSQTSAAIEGNIGFAVNDRLDLGVGIKADRINTTIPSASPALSTSGERVDAVLRADYALSPTTSVYGYARKTVSRTGSRALNDRAGAGASFRVNDRLTFDAEVSTGTGGPGAAINGSWQIDDNNQVYIGYGLSPATPGTPGENKLTFGGRSRLNDTLYFFGEQNYIAGTGSGGKTSTVGLEYTPTDAWAFGVQIESGNLSDPTAGDITRRAASLSATYSSDGTRASSKLEYRSDTGASLRETWLSRTTLTYTVTDNWRALASLDYAVSTSSAAPTTDSSYIEAVLGYAYRPVDNDRLNVLFKYTYLYDSGAPTQIGAGGAAWNYAQQSNVLSADAMYQVTPKLSLGAKVGVRMGALRDTSVAGSSWQTSDARLAILRADWAFANDWSLLVEGRYLDTPAVSSNKSGALFGIYRNIGDNLRIGGGYNMTGFSDDLTNQNYTSQGWYLNLVAKM